jgi:hypothetical protein
MIGWVTIVLCVLSLALSGFAIFLQYHIPRKYERLRKRNQQVYEFRLWVLNNRYDLYERLPDYETMVHDKRPVKLETYFPEINN